MGGALIRRIALMVLVCAVPVHAVIGDLNLDGVVDLQDFFILADNLGREGAPVWAFQIASRSFDRRAAVCRSLNANTRTPSFFMTINGPNQLIR